MKIANMLDLKNSANDAIDDEIYEAGASEEPVECGPRLVDEAPMWAKRRWHELVVERKEYTPHEMASKLSLCLGFRREWIKEA